jgi:hypothetical protein
VSFVVGDTGSVFNTLPRKIKKLVSVIYLFFDLFVVQRFTPENQEVSFRHLFFCGALPHAPVKGRCPLTILFLIGGLSG